MDGTIMLKKIIDYYCNGNVRQFARMLNISPQTVYSWIRRGAFDLKIVYENCFGLNAAWLITGEGDMLNSRDKNLLEKHRLVSQRDCD